MKYPELQRSLWQPGGINCNGCVDKILGQLQSADNDVNLEVEDVNPEVELGNQKATITSSLEESQIQSLILLIAWRVLAQALNQSIKKPLKMGCFFTSPLR